MEDVKEVNSENRTAALSTYPFSFLSLNAREKESLNFYQKQVLTIYAFLFVRDTVDEL